MYFIFRKYVNYMNENPDKDVLEYLENYMEIKKGGNGGLQINLPGI